MDKIKYFSMIIMLYFMCLLKCSDEIKATSNIRTDEDALLALKAHITDDPQHLLASNWSKDTSVCDWIGITCGTRHRRVRSILLMDMSLTGTIPPQIGNLSFLVNFSLSHNSFHGFLPTELSNLRRLKWFGLTDNLFSGIIPSWIGSFSQLQYLGLDANNFEGGFPTFVCNLSKLNYLYLEMNNLEGQIPEAIANLQNLKLLSLRKNMFSGGVPIGIFNISSLEEIYIGNNWLSGSISATFLKNMSSLRVLSFAVNNLTGHLPQNMFTHLPALELLSFSWNSLTGPIPSTLFACKRLQILSLSLNNFRGDLHRDFGNLTMLQKLYLGYNNFTGEISKSIGNLIKLEVLNMARNSISGKIPSSIGNITHLRDLDLSENNLRGNIPFEVGNFAYIKYMFFGVNNLDGVIPRSICNVSTLTAFGVDDNHLSALPIWQRISIHELQQATNKFDELNLLGRGTFGSVYRGNLSNGLSVAVKVFNLEAEGAFKSFDVECEVVRGIRHRNLVKIITSCCTSEFKALVMEFMPNWSLEKWLYSHNYFLDIFQRLNIMIDVASAVEYIHYGSTNPIIHCDLKPSNILLDEDMVAHVTDFGIAKLIGEDQSFIQTITLATVGYMAPEYGSEGLVSIKGDIYSFGILLIESFTRKRPTDEMFNEDMSMKQWVKDSLPFGVPQLVDPNLLRVSERHYLAKLNCTTSIMNLALKCCADVSAERISSKDVLSSLNKIKVKLFNDIQQA
ncbi:putative receptor-like protein kinase At3g47110 isoform X3 [Euphorbia lathyris]|uniref:putative receptor-like protein kinase At3g47110 isoform X3 n=1 Tax=Euphorbia lathyris TaxID=212925 RepID=UPI00331424CA